MSKSFLRRKDADAWAREMEIRADRSELPADSGVLKTIRLADFITRYRKEVAPKKRGRKIEDAVLAQLWRPPTGLHLHQSRAHFACGCSIGE